MTNPPPPSDGLDPTDFGASYGRRQVPPTPPRGDESIPDVLARVGDLVAEPVGDDPSPDAPDALGDVTASATSAGGEVAVEVRETTVVRLRLDPHWLQTADATDIEAVVQRTVNAALAEWTDRTVDQLMNGQLVQNGLAGRITQLQREMHDAFARDLARVNEAAYETARRIGGAS